MYKIFSVILYVFALIGVLLSVLLVVILVRPTTLSFVGIHEVSSDLYTCMTYKDPVLIQQIFQQGMNLKEAREIADTESDVDAYTQCLEELFGYHTVWINENHSIIYD